MAAPVTIPPMAIMARRPFLSSASCISFCFSGSVGKRPRGSNDQSPGALSYLPKPARAGKDMASARLIQRKIWDMESGSLSCASMTFGMFSKENCSPGMRMNSGTTNPTVASMAWRPCFSSASRNQGSHSGARSEKPAGSKFFDVLAVVKGMGSGPSPPTIPSAKAFTATLVLEDLAGVKAAAEPARAARIRAAVFAMITQETYSVR
mmetsp:Transcript_19795/g.26141  ORF Transcript_19795/g.26141 Transcript_19795/m.26141 type:complete len:207 (-) Transcript_19795:65-685(-)